MSKRWVEGCRHEPTLNRSGTCDPIGVCAHYTAGRSLENTIRRFKNPAYQVSSHLVAGVSGECVQMVACERKAWHISSTKAAPLELPRDVTTASGKVYRAGEVLRGLNAHFLGIEFDNDGPLKDLRSGRRRYTEDECVKANGLYWPKYPPIQIATAAQWVRDCIARGWLPRDFMHIGHSDVQAGKRDPGPAFPWESWIALCAR